MKTLTTHFLIRRWAAVAAALGAAAVLRAGGGACTPALGGLTLVIPAGGARALSLPLAGTPSARGAAFGRVSAVGPDFVEVAGADWTPGLFLAAVNPYYLRLRTGAAAGRVFPVESNTATRLQLDTDGADLTAAGGAVAPGDAWELVPADTLASLLPAEILQGGAAAAEADNVQVWSGSAFRTYYFNTIRRRWEEAAHPEADCGALVLRPDRGFLIVRRGRTELRLTLIGRVAEVAPRYWHARPGVTLLATGLPVDTTLGALGLQNRAGGWLGATDRLAAFTDADLVEIGPGADPKLFFFDGASGHWRLAGDAAGHDQDGFKLTAGTPLMIHRLATPPSAADALILMPLPAEFR